MTTPAFRQAATKPIFRNSVIRRAVDGNRAKLGVGRGDLRFPAVLQLRHLPFDDGQLFIAPLTRLHHERPRVLSAGVLYRVFHRFGDRRRQIERGATAEIVSLHDHVAAAS